MPPAKETKKRKAAAFDPEQEYPIRRIAGHNETHYLIEWEDGPDSKVYPPTWEPKAHANCIAVEHYRQYLATRAKRVKIKLTSTRPPNINLTQPAATATSSQSTTTTNSTATNATTTNSTTTNPTTIVPTTPTTATRNTPRPADPIANAATPQSIVMATATPTRSARLRRRTTKTSSPKY